MGWIQILFHTSVRKPYESKISILGDPFFSTELTVMLGLALYVLFWQNLYKVIILSLCGHLSATTINFNSSREVSVWKTYEPWNELELKHSIFYLKSLVVFASNKYNCKFSDKNDHFFQSTFHKPTNRWTKVSLTNCCVSECFHSNTTTTWVNAHGSTFLHLVSPTPRSESLPGLLGSNAR